MLTLTCECGANLIFPQPDWGQTAYILCPVCFNSITVVVNRQE